MLRILFWNIKNRNLHELVANAAASLKLDIVILCEVPSSHKDLLKSLKLKDSRFHFSKGLVSSIGDDRFYLFSRFDKSLMKLRKEHERFLVFEVNLPAREPFILMALHGPSKASGWTSEDISAELAAYAASLRSIQKESQLRKAVVVGDFNVNPFESGLIGTNAFHAVMDERLARKGSRLVQKKQYSYFHNPMWRLYGTASDGPMGSIYHSGSRHRELFWHMLDQVIVSAEMLEHFDSDSVRILDRIGDTTLTTAAGRPRKQSISDHLPLYFELQV